MSTFSKVTAKIVRQIDPDGSLIHVSRINDADKLVPMAMVVRQSRRWWWQRPKYKYQPHDFTLSDIFQGETPLSPGVTNDTNEGSVPYWTNGVRVLISCMLAHWKHSHGSLRGFQMAPYRVLENRCYSKWNRAFISPIDNTCEGNVSEIDLLTYVGRFGEVFSGNLEANVGVASAQLQGQSTDQLQSELGELKKQKVDVKKLLRDTKNRSVDLQHVLVRQLKRGHVLAVLTERIVASSTCRVSEQHSRKGLLGLVVNTVMGCVKQNAKVQASQASQESIEIPPGAVIAYSLRQLKIEENGGFDICLQDDGIESDCFFEEDGLIPDKIPELQNPQVYLSLLAELPQATRSALSQMLCEVMKDRDALSDVESHLEEWRTGDASVTHSNSATAILDLLRPYQLRTDPDSHIESDGPGSAGSLLTAAHLLVSAMEALPDEALILLSEVLSFPDVLEAFNALLIMLDLKDQQKNCSSLPLESLPLPLQDDKAFHWVQQLLITSNVNLRKEAEQLLAERESEPGVLPLVLCVTVQGLFYLCDQQN